MRVHTHTHFQSINIKFSSKLLKNNVIYGTDSPVNLTDGGCPFTAKENDVNGKFTNSSHEQFGEEEG